MVLATSVSSSQDDNTSLAYCEALASKLNSLSDLPASCREYQSVVQKIADKEDPFAGMRAGTASRARAAREQGRESHHQIQRRLTTRATRSNTFSKVDK